MKKGNYSEQNKQRMKISNEVKNPSRLQELLDFCKICGYKKIGVANCKGVQEYADKFVKILTDAGFEVCSVNCKQSGLDGVEICDNMSGPCCDPLSQANYLNEQKTDFNINFGLCLGHGLLFQKYSNAEVTTFLVKSMGNNHNILDLLE